MALPRVIFCLSIVLQLSILSAQCQDVASVFFEQRGVAAEPLEASRTITFAVHLQPQNAMAMKKLELDVGPDANDVEVSKTFTLEENSYLASGEAKDFRFDVNFLSPEMRQGDFGRWLLDKNETGVWDKAWYRLKITQFIGSPIVVENYEGHPRIYKPFENFRNGMVSPLKGTNQSTYTYEVEAQSNSNDSILMKVAPSQNGPWTEKGSRNYTNVGAWQKLVWENISLGFDFNTAYYKFAGRKESETFGGPSWPVNYTYRNASVSPTRGLPESHFNYGFDFRAEKRLNVELNVWDVDTRIYRSAGTVLYDNVSNWERLVWPDIRLTEDPEARGSSNYYFSVYYPGSEKPISTTKAESDSYPGPEIVPIELRNASVQPYNGSLYLTSPQSGSISRLYTYTYSAEVNGCQNKGPVEIRLEIYDPVSRRWLNGGLQTYEPGMANLSYAVNFANLFNGPFLGETKYRFISNDIVLGEFPGPWIDTNFRNESATETGRMINYQVEVRSSLPRVPVALDYTTDNSRWQMNQDRRIYESRSQNWTTLTWKAYPRYYSVEFEAVREET